jgi:hypothetical protein
MQHGNRDIKSGQRNFLSYKPLIVRASWRSFSSLELTDGRGPKVTKVAPNGASLGDFCDFSGFRKHSGTADCPAQLPRPYSLP